MDKYSIFRDPEKKAQLEIANKWHHIDLDLVEKELCGLQRVEKINHLSEFYPSLARFVLNQFNLTDEIKEYQKICKAFETDPYNYCLYVHGYFFPWIEQKRTKGKIKQGKSSLDPNLSSKARHRSNFYVIGTIHALNTITRGKLTRPISLVDMVKQFH